MSLPDPPDLPNDGVFDAPWQAQVFALTVALNEAGHLAWADWAEELSSHLHAPGAAQDGSDYYARWAAALEAVLVSADITDTPHLTRTAAAWQRAARATPHGTAITLDNDPLA